MHRWQDSGAIGDKTTTEVDDPKVVRQKLIMPKWHLSFVGVGGRGNVRMASTLDACGWMPSVVGEVVVPEEIKR